MGQIPHSTERISSSKKKPDATGAKLLNNSLKRNNLMRILVKYQTFRYDVEGAVNEHNGILAHNAATLVARQCVCDSGHPSVTQHDLYRI